MVSVTNIWLFRFFTALAGILVVQSAFAADNLLSLNACRKALLVPGEATYFFDGKRTSHRQMLKAIEENRVGVGIYYENENDIPSSLTVRDMMDKKQGKDLFIKAKLKEGELSFHIKTVDRFGERSKALKGSILFDLMMEHFSKHVRTIKAQWDYGDNLATVNKLTAQGMDLIEATHHTWTAKQAARYGFTEIQLYPKTSEHHFPIIGNAGKYHIVTVLITKKHE